MTNSEREQYLYFAFVFDDDLDMMAHALIQLGGIHVKPSRLKELMLGYNVSQYIGIMGEIVNHPYKKIIRWKRKYFRILKMEEEEREKNKARRFEKARRKAEREGRACSVFFKNTTEEGQKTIYDFLEEKENDA